MGPPGIEPENNPERSDHSERQNQVKDGQNQGLAPENRTDTDGAGITQEPAKTTTVYTTDSDLKSVVDAWPELSQEARQAIAGIVGAEKNKRGQAWT